MMRQQKNEVFQKKVLTQLNGFFTSHSIMHVGTVKKIKDRIVIVNSFVDKRR